MNKSVGRMAGILFLIQALIAIPIYSHFGMMRPISGSADYLAGAAASATQVRVAVLLTYVLGGLTLAAALWAWPVFRRYSERMALLFLSLCVAGLAMRAVESAAIEDMISLSAMYTKDGAPRELLEPLGELARSHWFSTHFLNLMLGHITPFVFFLILFQFALVPRALAAVGLAATALSTYAVTVPLLGYPFSFGLVAPTALMQIVLSLWLIAKGFADRPYPARSDGELVEPSAASA